MTSLSILITGSSSGLGKSFAKQFAQKGYQLVLVSLPGEGLIEYGKQLQKEYGVNVLSIESDISTPGACEAIFEQIGSLGIQLGGLVNNAGISYIYGFDKAGMSLYNRVIDLNIRSLVHLTYLFANQSQKNDNPWILNLGSLGGFFPLPRKAVYAASKSFVINFSRSLDIELASANIRVCVLCPGTVNTNDRIRLTNKEGGWFARKSVMETDDVTSYAVKCLLRGDKVIIPGFFNNLFLVLDRILPGFLKRKLLESNFRKIHQNIKHGITIGKGNM